MVCAVVRLEFDIGVVIAVDVSDIEGGPRDGDVVPVVLAGGCELERNIVFIRAWVELFELSITADFLHRHDAHRVVHKNVEVASVSVHEHLIPLGGIHLLVRVHDVGAFVCGLV